MAIFIYESGTKAYIKSTNRSIATKGFVPNKIAIQVATDGFIRPVLVDNDVDIIFGGSALISARLDYFPAGELILDGASAPTAAVLDGQQLFTYPGIGTLNLDGSAPVTFNQANGTIEYVYTPVQTDPLTFDGNVDDTEIIMNYISSGTGIVFDGESEVGITQNYDSVEGGIVFDGSAGTFFKDGEIGGRGVLRRPRVRQPVVYQHEPSLYRKDAWNLKFFRSDTQVEFVDGKKYKFINDLPKYIPPKDISKSFLRSLPKQTPVVFDFVSEPKQPTFTIIPVPSPVEFYSHNDYLIKQDEDLINELMLDESKPFVAVTYDNNINKIRKDDEYILENFLL